ncbi:MAG TPA: glucoamylase family protein [Blastocatellia bacterium]|nr:glucoamylase family protein [Blastocatellia bacterium]
MLSAVVCLVLAVCTLANSTVAMTAERYRLSKIEEAFLEDLSHRAFLYFWEQTDPDTGLVLDRVGADGTPHDDTHRNVASIAATGFGLTALCIAAARGWVQPHAARDRARTTLRFFAERAPRVHGWFYHWMDTRTGARKWNCEVSSIDTALLLGGVLTARQFFRGDREIYRLATKLYEDVDFQWMQNGHPGLLSHGWRPESGFLAPMWDTYSEHTILYLLAIASPKHQITPGSWWAWKRDWITYAGYSYMAGAAPLFIHQYSQAWVDYRGQREKQLPHINYFENSIKATRAHRAFCIDLAKEFPGYSETIWGITASDSAKGYVAWGGPPRDPNIDGTVVPSAAAGSLMFTPDICLSALLSMRDRFVKPDKSIWGRYGFVDAFNPNTGWIDRDVIGINVGITLLSAENLRTGFVWRWFMRNAEIPSAMRSVGLIKERLLSHRFASSRPPARFASFGNE